jgi:PKD repeat protein
MLTNTGTGKQYVIEKTLTVTVPPHIDQAVPSRGVVGTSVTLHGSGFTGVREVTVVGAKPNVLAAVTNISVSSDTALSFTFPTTMFDRMFYQDVDVLPGTYRISVTRGNDNAISNTIPFDVDATSSSRISFFSVRDNNTVQVGGYATLQWGGEDLKQCDLLAATNPNGSYIDQYNGGSYTPFALGVGVGGSFDSIASQYKAYPTRPDTMIILRCVGSDGATSISVVHLFVTLPPFSVSPTSGPAPLVVTFTGVGNSITFGDNSGQAASSDGLIGQTTHTYTNPETYTATSGGSSVSIVATGNQAPSFSATPTSGEAPLAVYFNAGSYQNGNSVPTMTIDFGDGTPGKVTMQVCTNSIPGSCSYGATHTYNSAGTYTATLIQHVGGPSGPEQQIGTAVVVVGNTPPTMPPAGPPSTVTSQSTGTKTNLANALTALESALKVLISMFGR